MSTVPKRPSAAMSVPTITVSNSPLVEALVSRLKTSIPSHSLGKGNVASVCLKQFSSVPFVANLRQDYCSFCIGVKLEKQLSIIKHGSIGDMRLYKYYF